MAYRTMITFKLQRNNFERDIFRLVMANTAANVYVSRTYAKDLPVHEAACEAIAEYLVNDFLKVTGR